MSNYINHPTFGSSEDAEPDDIEPQALLIRESVLFAAHGGTIGGRRGTICTNDSALPLAFSRGPDAPGAEHGLFALWEQNCEPIHFFGDSQYDGIGLPHFEAYRGASNSDGPGGLFVYDCEWILGTDGWPTVTEEDDDDPTLHLRGGNLRRPSMDEVHALIVGQSPWTEGVLL